MIQPAPAGGHVVTASDKFKGSLTAVEVADHVSAGLRAAIPTLPIRTVPIADGGEGTLQAALSAGFLRVDVTAAGPTGEPVQAAVAIKDRTAVVELAQASGLRLLPDGRPDALNASSYGTGQLIRAALDGGCGRIVLGLGGSACTDGGAGLVQALGGALLDSSGTELPRGGAALTRLHTIDLSSLDPRLRQAEVIMACDVDNPLLGPLGAAAVYGPQKGATAEDIEVLDAALAHWAEATAAVVGGEHARRPGAGAAGGVGFAAMAFLGVQPSAGIEILMDLLGFRQELAGARLVITGEGSLDAQSLHGKAPIGVAAAAGAQGVPVVAVAGRTELSAEQLRGAGIRAAYALTDLESDPARCIRDAGALLEQRAAAIAVDWLIDPSSATGPHPDDHPDHLEKFPSDA
ncbi:glycerate kinase [Streptomyces malaysiensis]|uniref:Glycerate kinase n=1 Tax=Streptomyces autolyticus TaxID=75293 RepID=A0ABM6H665_9ACTN|nr:glycerate kinase [Streptomyces autolyticus]AQA09339.1 glycerate kinase [Streptomyces autolyticus]